MRRSTCLLLVVLFGSWLSSFGQTAPKLRYPKIVATFERVGQTDKIPPTTIYTPPKWGTFRATLIMVLTRGNGEQEAGWSGIVRFTNGGGTFGGPAVELPTSNRTAGYSEMPIRAIAGRPITFEVDSSGDTSGSKYNVWLVVEQLM
jgi:hypothetical protein